MPIEVGIWRLGEKLQRIRMSLLTSKAKLEETLVADLSILRPEALLLGRQVPTAFGKFIDLLAIDQAGSLIVIEFKKNRTPRDVVAQLLDYGSCNRGPGLVALPRKARKIPDTPEESP